VQVFFQEKQDWNNNIILIIIVIITGCRKADNKRYMTYDTMHDLHWKTGRQAARLI